MWTDEDRDIVLAWQVEQALVCKGCGHPIDESHDPDNEGRYDAEHVRCHACKARGVAEQNFRDNEANNPYGVKWRTTLRG